MDFHVSPVLLRNKTNISPGSPTQPRKNILNKHGIKPIDIFITALVSLFFSLLLPRSSSHFCLFDTNVHLGGLRRETLEDHDVVTLRGQKRELGALIEKKDALTQIISIAREGYNDEGVSMDDLELSLHRVIIIYQ